MYALSTSWNAWRAKSGEEMANEAVELGFSNLELSFSLPIKYFEQFKDLKKAGKVNIVSLHNFCPLPYATANSATPDMFLLSSPDERERHRAVRFTKQTIESAKEIGAVCVVLHLGRVDFAYDGSRTLIKMLERGKTQTQYYKFLKGMFLRKRENRKKRYLTQAVNSLDELNDFAAEKNIKLGIENRYYVREIPSFEEIGFVLDKFPSGNVYYWHDTGHAQFKENLGIDSHEEYLKNYSNRIIGMHIHDIVRSSDHRAPLEGDYDFMKLKPYLNSETIKVFEPHEPATAKQIEEGFRYFKDQICTE